MPYRVLIVEDEVDLRDALRDSMNLEGFAADGVGSVASYKAWRQTHSCDVLIVDRNLPDGDGLEIIRLHRQTESGPVIIITCEGAPEDRISGMNADADYYLVKPLVTDELIAILRRFSRREESVGLGGNGSWVLDSVKWNLTKVGGLQIGLTKKELNLLSNFVEKPGLTVTYLEMIQALSASPELYDRRNLEALVRRFRLKAEKLGIEDFPLTNVYGVGFVFNGFMSVV